jgi:hypothetical protein
MIYCNLITFTTHDSLRNPSFIEDFLTDMNEMLSSTSIESMHTNNDVVILVRNL